VTGFSAAAAMRGGSISNLNDTAKAAVNGDRVVRQFIEINDWLDHGTDWAAYLKWDFLPYR